MTAQNAKNVTDFVSFNAMITMFGIKIDKIQLSLQQLEFNLFSLSNNKKTMLHKAYKVS